MVSGIDQSTAINHWARTKRRSFKSGEETERSIVIYEADGKKIEIKVDENDKLVEILGD